MEPVRLPLTMDVATAKRRPRGTRQVVVMSLGGAAVRVFSTWALAMAHVAWRIEQEPDQFWWGEKYDSDLGPAQWLHHRRDTDNPGAEDRSIHFKTLPIHGAAWARERAL